MKRLEVSGAVRPIYGSLGVKRLKKLLCESRVLRSGERRSSYCVHKMALKVRSEIHHARPFKALPHADAVRLRVKSGSGTLRCVLYVSLCLRRASYQT